VDTDARGHWLILVRRMQRSARRFCLAQAGAQTPALHLAQAAVTRPISSRRGVTGMDWRIVGRVTKTPAMLLSSGARAHDHPPPPPHRAGRKDEGRGAKRDDDRSARCARKTTACLRAQRRFVDHTERSPLRRPSPNTRSTRPPLRTRTVSSAISRHHCGCCRRSIWVRRGRQSPASTRRTWPGLR